MRHALQQMRHRLGAGRHRARPPLALVALVAVAVAGCGDGPPAPEDRRGAGASTRVPSPSPPTMSPEMKSLLDEGYAAFEAGDLSGALRSYEAAVEADSTVAAAWFGVYMTYDALGETERAGEIRERLTRMGAPGPGDPHAASDDGPPSLETSAGEEEGA